MLSVGPTSINIFSESSIETCEIESQPNSEEFLTIYKLKKKV